MVRALGELVLMQNKGCLHHGDNYLQQAAMAGSAECWERYQDKAGQGGGRQGKAINTASPGGFLYPGHRPSAEALG